MKKSIFLLVLLIILTFFVAGCSSTNKEPPDISITIDSKEIEYVSAKNKWNGSVYDREDTFVTILKEQKDIPIFENGSIAEITFKSNPPDEFKIMDILIDENGRQIYTDKEIINIPVELNNGKCSFAIEKHLASFLSSQYEPGKKDIRGFRMIATWGENECEYAFIIKTYSTYEGASADYLTGEIITDGIYVKKDVYYIYFIPDKETRQLLNYHYPLEIGESIPLKFESMDIIKDLPKELGIYNVAVEVDLTGNTWGTDLKSIKLIDDIGTIEYKGKTYETNDLDENVQPKDWVCGLIVENVRRFDDGGVIISFEGEIESEGFYNVYPGGDMFQYQRIGQIIRDKESFKNFPTYKGQGNNFSVWFSETNELYEELANYSAIGRGRFKSSNYYIVYNYGIGAGPGEVLTEIVYLDENHKDLFEYNENEISIMGFDEDYLIVSENKKNGLETVESKYYFVSRRDPSVIKIASSNDKFGYRFEKSNDDASRKDGSDFDFLYYNYGNSIYDEKRAHTLKFRYFNKNDTGNDADILTKDVNYGIFKNGENTIEVYEGNEFLNMVADDISVLYYCNENSPDELARIRIKFTGEITLTGKLDITVDEEFGYQVYFLADSESISKIPHHIEDTRDAGGIRFVNENLKEILGEEPFSKNCEITIKDYYIEYAARETYNTGELVSVRFSE